MQTAISTDIGARSGAGLDRLGAGRGKVLAQMNLKSFRDLVDYPPLVGARMLMAQRRGDLAGIDLKKYLVEEFIARDPLQAARSPAVPPGRRSGALRAVLPAAWCLPVPRRWA